MPSGITAPSRRTAPWPDGAAHVHQPQAYPSPVGAHCVRPEPPLARRVSVGATCVSALGAYRRPRAHAVRPYGGMDGFGQPASRLWPLERGRPCQGAPKKSATPRPCRGALHAPFPCRYPCRRLRPTRAHAMRPLEKGLAAVQKHVGRSIFMPSPRARRRRRRLAVIE
jgi:hypothetical protein